MRKREGEQTGGRPGPRGQDRERGQRGSAATRIAPQCARAGRRAEGQRRQGREEGVPRRHEGAGVGQKHKGAPQPSEPPAVRGGTGQGGVPRRDVQRGPGACLRLAYTVTSKRWRGHRAGEAWRAKRDEGRRGVRSDQRTTSLEARAPGGGKEKREWERCVAGRVQRERGQGDRGTKMQGPGKGSEGGRGGTRTPGAGLGQRTGAEGGGKEGGLLRELLRPALARAERVSDEGNRGVLSVRRAQRAREGAAGAG